jgi:REP element-mobilizing transposase RayT
MSAGCARRFARPDKSALFSIDAVVILPDHLHAILTLPQGDADFAGRWRRIKGHFSTQLSLRAPLSDVMRMANSHFGKDVIGNILSVMSTILPGTWITFITIL